MTLEREITFGDKYGPAMEITDQDEADAYFELCVEHTMSWGRTREEAEQIEKENLGYYAGYCDHETRIRVERLFNCMHPFLGRASISVPTAEEAFKMGQERAKEEQDAILRGELQGHL